jgi:hypothetical protein
VGNIAAPEGTADDHLESVEVDVLDVDGGFVDAASDNARLLPGQTSCSKVRKPDESIDSLEISTYGKPQRPC